MRTAREAFALTFSGPVLKRSLAVAAIVGTILNAINQGPQIVAGEAVVVWKLALTYCIPFLVASYAAWSALRSG